MGRKELFKFLPSEIINDILLRLPVKSIAVSKCVCRSWLCLLESDEFVKSHHASSTQSCLAVLMNNSNRCSVYEFEQEIDDREPRSIHLTTFDCPRNLKIYPPKVTIEGSANGLLLLLFVDGFNAGALYVCNPISRQYFELINRPLGFLEKVCVDYWGYLRVHYGFGVSKVSGEYKVFRMMEYDDHCHVYTLGTTSWRRVGAAPDLPSFGYYFRDPCAFINGNLHWFARSFEGDNDNNISLISCFDLETECFTTFSHPPIVPSSKRNHTLFTLRDCLGWCDHTFLEEGGTVGIWLMKEYGVEKSWTKEYVINFHPHFDTTHLQCVTPIQVFKDGGILIQGEWGSRHLLFYYSNEMKTTQQYGDPHDIDARIYPVFLTPSFLSLRSFRMENVCSF